MRVAYLTGEKNGASWYRLQQPLQLLDELGEASVLEMTQANAEVTAASDIAVMPAVFGNREKAGFLKDGGTKLVLDLWDDPLEISPMSPSYKTWGIVDVFFKTDAGDVPIWQDGVNGFDIAKNFDRQQAFKDFLGVADLVTVTTQRLGERMLPYCRKIRVLPDSIDLKRWRTRPLIKDESIVRLYWGGGSSHYPDMKMIEEPLYQVMSKYPQVNLSWMGEHFRGGPSKRLSEFEARINRLPWHPSCCYPTVLATEGIDIGLIPLRGNSFDECKSPLKWAELASLGIPAVTSFVPPYADLGDEVMLAVGDNTAEGWISALEWAIEHPSERQEIGQKARQLVAEQFDARANVKLWAKAYEEVLNDGD